MNETIINLLQQTRVILPEKKRRWEKVNLTGPGKILHFEADDAVADDILDLIVNDRDTTNIRHLY